MAIRTKDDLLTSIRDRFADDTSDETLSFLEDVTDTISDFESRATDTTNWKERYESNDREWREKYRDRFFNSSGSDDNDNIIDEPENKPMRFEDLFKTV